MSNVPSSLAIAEWDAAHCVACAHRERSLWLIEWIDEHLSPTEWLIRWRATTIALVALKVLCTAFPLRAAWRRQPGRAAAFTLVVVLVWAVLEWAVPTEPNMSVAEPIITHGDRGMRGSDVGLFMPSRTATGRTDGFERYETGSIEAYWIHRSHSANGSLCKMAMRPSALAAVVPWLAYAHAQQRAFSNVTRTSIAAVPGRSPTRYVPLRQVQPTAAQREHLSRLVYRNADGERVDRPIEPLTGVGRHPLAVRWTCKQQNATYAAAGLFDIGHLLLHNACDERGLPQQPRARHAENAAPRNLFFDLGCTVYDDGQKLDPHEGSGSGPSLPLFFQLYERRCILFDELHGWEAKKWFLPWWWRSVPAAMRPRLHFHNVPVIEGSMGDVLVRRAWATGSSRANTWLGQPTSFLRVLNATARPSDFVVVKVDIDNGPELQVVHALAELPELTALVDELFFEDHYYYDGHDFGWGATGSDRANTVDNALRLMQTLRRKGVRAHFWI